MSELMLDRYGLQINDQTKVNTEGIFMSEQKSMTVSELVQHLEQTYCGCLAAEFDYLEVGMI